MYLPKTYNKILVFFIAAVFSFSFFCTLAPKNTKAITGSEWKAGRIIDDAVFFNKDSMSVGQIQDFLNAKVPNCDRWNSTTFSYAGKPYGPPYTCLKEYQENPTTHENNIKRFNSNGTPYNVPGSQSAAQIIYDAAQAYSINPQVLIVMLQKETAIVTDTWAAGWQYDRAMGYGCPDTGPNGTANCNTSYYGFYNQVGNAAWQLRRYVTVPDQYNFKAGVTRNILWQVSTAGCGSSPVYLENSATAALYNYTPYQPNQAALSNLYGLGDGCSAYGNRNFWRLFSDWFGSTTASPYSWSYISQEAFVDKEKTIPAELSNTYPGGRYYIRVKALNTGTSTWEKGNVNIATSSPAGRNSQIKDSTWINDSRAGTLDEIAVAPGQVGTFEFWVTMPQSPNNLTEYFNLVAEGKTWMNDIGMFLGINIKAPQYSWQYISQTAYTDSNKNTIANLSSLSPGSKLYISLRVKNTGNLGWGNTFLNLATSSPKDRLNSSAYDQSWLSPNRITTATTSMVYPGHQGLFEFWINTTRSTGQHKEYFSLVADGYNWLNDIGMNVNYNILSPHYQWEYISQGAFTSNDMSTQIGSNNLSLASNSRYYLTISAKNTGNATWYSSNTSLGTSGPKDRLSQFYDSSWPSHNRATYLDEQSVAPGNYGTFKFWIHTPSTKGNYNEYFNPVVDGVTWLNDLGQYYNLIVN